MCTLGFCGIISSIQAAYGPDDPEKGGTGSDCSVASMRNAEVYLSTKPARCPPCPRRTNRHASRSESEHGTVVALCL